MRGDGDKRIDNLASLAEAGDGDLAFCERGTGADKLRATRASALLAPPELAENVPCALLLSTKPRLDFARLTALYDRRPVPAVGVSPAAWVAEDAQLAEDVAVAPGAVVESGVVLEAGVRIGAGSVVGEGSRIGEGSRLHARVTLYDGVRIGRNCILHSGAVIGADGFGFVPHAEGYQKFHQLGGVRIGDDFECGAMVTVDRGALDDTCIGVGVKLDDHVHVAHNVHIGDHTAIAGFTGIGGGVRIGRWCAIGGNVIIVGHLEIADRVFVEATSMIGKSVRTPGQRLSSNWPAEDAKLWRKWQMRMRRNQ